MLEYLAYYHRVKPGKCKAFVDGVYPLGKNHEAALNAWMLILMNSGANWPKSMRRKVINVRSNIMVSGFELRFATALRDWIQDQRSQFFEEFDAIVVRSIPLRVLAN